MSFSFRRLGVMLAKKLVKIFLVCALLFGGCVFILTQQNRSPYDWELENKHNELTNRAKELSAARSTKALFIPGPKHAEFQKLVGELYPSVGMVQFINPNLLRVTFATEEKHKEGICQAIANVWCFKSKEQNISVQCWEGENCVAMGNVFSGRMPRITGVKEPNF